MFDLRLISSVAPIGDIAFGIFIMLAAIVFANLAILPKLYSQDQRSAVTLSAVSASALVGVAAVLAFWTPWTYVAVFIYAALFLTVGLAVSWQTAISRLQVIVRVCSGAAGVLLSLYAAYMVTHIAR